MFKKKIGFKAIAVTCAINLDGSVVVTETTEYSVNVDKFLIFLEQIVKQRKSKLEPIHLFLDNLRVHHSLRVKEFCAKNRINLVFNASYSSEYNPIERLWALSKKIFSKSLIEHNIPS